METVLKTIWIILTVPGGGGGGGVGRDLVMAALTASKVMISMIVEDRFALLR